MLHYLGEINFPNMEVSLSIIFSVVSVTLLLREKNISKGFRFPNVHCFLNDGLLRHWKFCRCISLRFSETHYLGIPYPQYPFKFTYSLPIFCTPISRIHLPILSRLWTQTIDQVPQVRELIRGPHTIRI